MNEVVWNIELLKTSNEKYTIYFLSSENVFQKIINKNNKLYDFCDELHKVDKTYWTLKTLPNVNPSTSLSDDELKKIMI